MAATTAKTYKSSTGKSATNKTYEVFLKITTGRNTYSAENAKVLGTALEYWLEDADFYDYELEVKDVTNVKS